MTWWTLGDMAWVLELDAPALELHWHVVGGRSFAWWCDEQGRWLVRVRVGSA